MAAIDHLIWAVPDLEAGMSDFRELTGVTPHEGGTHTSLGTRNALVALGRSTYLELLAPDPGTATPDNLGGRLAVRPAGLVTFAVRPPDLDAAMTGCERAGLGVTGPVAMSRQADDGALLSWRLGFPVSPRLRLHLPFFIDWADAPHPAATCAATVGLQEFRVVHPDAAALRSAYEMLGLDVAAEEGSRDMVAVLATPHGTVALSGAAIHEVSPEVSLLAP